MPPIEATPAVEEKKSVVGFIYPPPEVRNIVDKTANFVARNGPEFEARIRQNEQSNAKFNFLSVGDPYHSYYQHKVTELRNSNKEKEVSPSTGGQKISVVQHQKQQELLQAAVRESTVPKEAPAEFEFIADPPSISAFDLDVVRLTAQFVARNGRQFLTTLMNREQRNNQFDFLRPQHSLFQYFTRLLEQYTKVLIPPKELMKRLDAEATDPQAIMKQVKQRVEWDRHQSAMHQREEEELERERAEYAAIDWHDFSVVETIDYQPWEVGSFPPPTTPQEVGRRVLLQERIDEGVNPDNDMVIDSDDEIDEIGSDDDQVTERDNTQVQDMEQESSEEDSEDDTPMGRAQPQAGPKPGQVLVKDYNPKMRAQVNPASDEYLVSPITGERVPADKVGHHLKINMLDPRWLEDRDRQLAEKSNQETVFATGDSVKSTLKKLAERRTDIFGAGDEETGIGKKIGEEERKDDKVTWDGHTASMEAATRAARANISINEQIHQIHKVQGLLPDHEKEKIGPQPKLHDHLKISQPKPMSQPAPPAIVPKPISAPMVPGPMMNPMPMPMMMVPRAPMMIPRPNFMQPPMGFVPPQPPLPTHDEDTGEPYSKKPKTEDNLIGEQEWSRRFPGPIKFKIQIPHSTDKPEWQLTGQTIVLALPLTDSISSVKAKIHDDTGLPPAKQKLARDGVFFKDALSLAYYNIAPGSLIQLQLKERGGRKK